MSEAQTSKRERVIANGADPVLGVDLAAEEECGGSVRRSGDAGVR